MVTSVQRQILHPEVAGSSPARAIFLCLAQNVENVSIQIYLDLFGTIQNPDGHENTSCVANVKSGTLLNST